MPFAGLDCVGLIVVPAQNIGIEIEDYIRYGRQPNPRIFLGHIERHFDRIEADEVISGDIALFWILRKELPQHVGIMLEGGRMIHTYSNVKRVVEHNYDPYWQEHTHSFWRYKAFGNNSR